MNITLMKKRLRRLYDTLYKTFGPQGWWPADTRFEVIVGAILTQNTAWSNVEKAIRGLKAAKLLTPSAMYRVSEKKLAAAIRPSGYYNIKAARLKSFLGFLFTDYGGSLSRMFCRDMPALRRELLNVKGLGKETVDSILLYAGARPIFVVDAYTRRILSRHKLISEDADYDTTQRLFMDHLPHDNAMFGEYHALLVRLAKDICKNKNPRCGVCPVKKL